MPETIAQAQIDIVVNTRGVVSQFNQLKRQSEQQAGLVSKAFVTNFNNIANSAKRMGGVINSALKAATGPALALAGMAVKKLFDSTSDAGSEVKMKWAGFKKTLDESFVRMGYFITSSKVFGKTMWEWLDKFSRLLQKVTSQDVQKFINLLSKALVTIASITVGIRAISFGQGLIKLLSVIGGGKFLTGAAALGATTAGSGIGSFAGSTLSSLVASKLSALTSTPNIISRSGIDAAVDSILTDSPVKAIGKLKIALFNFSKSGNKLAAMFNVMTNSTMGLIGIFQKSILLRLGVVTALTLGGIKLYEKLSRGQDDKVDLTDAFSNRWLSGKDADEARRPDSYLSPSGMVRGRLPGETDIDAALRKKQFFAENRVQTIAEISARMSEEMKEALKRSSEYAEKVKEEFQQVSDQVLEKVRSEAEVSRISKDVEEQRARLLKESEDMAKDISRKRLDEEKQMENFRQSFSGQFSSGQDVVKFAQRIETEGARRLEEYNKNMLETAQQSKDKLEENRTELSLLNGKFDKFLKWAKAGLDPSDVAVGLGL